MLSAEDKKLLLKIARDAMERTARGSSSSGAPAGSEALSDDSGAFVSIHKNGRLRGCIGVFASREPLYMTVENMAKAASSQDPRFAPVGVEELKDIDIEISVLSPLRRITEMGEIEVGRHGIYVMKGRSRGVLLPQVAVEHGFDRETFLDETCVKAGLPADAWQNGAEVYVFEAEIFREKELMRS